MKKIILIAALLSLTACGKIDSAVNNVKAVTGNLTRTVTLYSANGQVIKTWVTENQIEYAGPVAGFIDKDGLNVRISGTFLIEGK